MTVVETVTHGLVVAADGGNSKTELVLADTAGAVLARVRGPGTRPHSTGLQAMVDDLHSLVVEARRLARRDGDEPIGVGAFSLANVDTEDDASNVRGVLDAAGLVEVPLVENDTMAVLRAGAPQGWGVAVVVGAGINAVGVAEDGRQERFLAMGPLSGDWGGGMGVSEAALGAAVRAGDGRGPKTVLRERLPAAFGYPTPEALAIELVNGRLGPMSLAYGAPVVLEAAEAGDSVARGIAERLMDEVAVMTTALVHRLTLEHERFPVVLGGGLMERGPHWLVDGIRQRVLKAASGASVERLSRPPVTGALIAAMRRAGAADAAVVRAIDGVERMEF